jgi:transposase
VGWLLLREQGDRSPQEAPQEAAFVDEILRRSPVVATMCGAVRRFFTMLRQHQAGALATWLEAADASGIPELAAFAQGVRRDLPAIQAAFTSPWSHDYVAYCTSSLGW